LIERRAKPLSSKEIANGLRTHAAGNNPIDNFNIGGKTWLAARLETPCADSV
jgi:hypothetical protein